MNFQSGLRYRKRDLGGGTSCACHSRRGFLAGMAAAGAAAALRPIAARAEAASPAARAVDVHHHIYPPQYLARRLPADRKRHRPRHSVQGQELVVAATVEKMDQAGVATAINSMTTPAVWFDDGDAARARSALVQRFRRPDDARCPGPFRHVRRHSTAGHRRQSARDRICARRAQARWHRGVDELCREASRRSGIRGGVRRTQSAQDNRFCPSHHDVLRQFHPRSECADHRISDGLDQDDYQPPVQRHLRAMLRHPLRFLSRRRNAAADRAAA